MPEQPFSSNLLLSLTLHRATLDFLSRDPSRSETDSRQEIFPLFTGHELVTASNIHLTVLDHHRVREVRRIISSWCGSFMGSK